MQSLPRDRAIIYSNDQRTAYTGRLLCIQGSGALLYCILFVTALMAGCKKSETPTSDVNTRPEASAPEDRSSNPTSANAAVADITRTANRMAVDAKARSIRMKQQSEMSRAMRDWRSAMSRVLDDWDKAQESAPARNHATRTVSSDDLQQLRTQRTSIEKAADARLASVRSALEDRIKQATSTDQLEEVEKGATRDQTAFLAFLEEETTLFNQSIAAASSRLAVAMHSVDAAAMAPRLTKELLDQIQDIHRRAAAHSVQWDSQVDLSPDNQLHQAYVDRLLKNDQVSSLVQADLIRLLPVAVLSENGETRRAAMKLVDNLNDPILVERLSTPDRLRSAQFRQEVLRQLPKLLTVSKAANTQDGRRIMHDLAGAYLIDPQAAHASTFDTTLHGIGDGELKRTKEYVWFLAAAAYSGSSVAETELFNVFTTTAQDSRQLSYLHDAADDSKQMHRFNYLIGALIARHAGNAPTNAFHQAIDTILAAKLGANIYGVSDLNDFLIGWFAAADPAFSDEALRIYRLVFTDPERKALGGHEAILAGFEAFRLGAIDMALHSQNGQANRGLLEVNKLYWQSERVVALQALREQHLLEKVPTESLAKIVEDPWSGTAAYKGDLFGNPMQRISVDQWMVYVSCLEERDPKTAGELLLRTALGKTRLRESNHGDEDMFPFRVHAVRRALAKDPSSFEDLLQYARAASCPLTMRLAILCQYAADHDHIGKQFLDRLPDELPPGSLSPRTNTYITGMLKGFAAIRGGVELSEMRSADEHAVEGYVHVVLSYANADLAQKALELLKYRRIQARLPRSDISLDIDGAELTPFHLMDRSKLQAAVKQFSAITSPDTEIEQYSAWLAKTWPPVEVFRMPRSADDARGIFLKENPVRVTIESSHRKGSEDDVRAFEAGPDKQTARRIGFCSGSVPPPVLKKALLVLAAQGTMDDLGQFVDCVVDHAPSDGRQFIKMPNLAVVIERRASSLEVIFADLQRVEESAKGSAHDQFVREIARRILKFVQVSNDALGKDN